MSFGPYLGFTHVNDILERLYGLGCTLEPSTVFGGTTAGERRDPAHPLEGGAGAPLRRDRGRACPGAPDTSLGAAVERSGARLLLAGDAVAPRTALHAFREGDDAGRAA